MFRKGSDVAPTDPGSGAPLRGQLRQTPEPSHLRLGPSRFALGAEERPTGREGVGRRDEKRRPPAGRNLRRRRR